MEYFKKLLFQLHASPKKIMVGFEDIKYAIHHTEYFIINTLPANNQDCLIYRTVPIEKEEMIINNVIDNHETNKVFIIYGKNSADETTRTKYDQLTSFGLTAYIYGGGLFEWLLLQDIYGFKEFPSSSVCKDLLKYKEPKILSPSPSLLSY